MTKDKIYLPDTSSYVMMGVRTVVNRGQAIMEDIYALDNSEQAVGDASHSVTKKSDQTPIYGELYEHDAVHVAEHASCLLVLLGLVDLYNSSSGASSVSVLDSSFLLLPFFFLYNTFFFLKQIFISN